MPHTFQIAPTGRARCRGCGQRIERGELRFGERLPNPYAEGETTLWFHPLCAAYRRPVSVLETLDATPDDVPGREALERAARGSLAHERLSRMGGAERAPSGQATCRSCRRPIPREGWRIRLSFYNEGRFSPGGFVHLECVEDYFGTREIAEPMLHFSPALSREERDELTRGLDGPGRRPSAPQPRRPPAPAPARETVD